MRHHPVMLDESIAALKPQAGGIYVDGTFGAGGYSEAILQAADCAVIAIDRDPEAIAGGRGLQEEYGARLTLVSGCFGALAQILPPLLSARGRAHIDGLTLDLGISSMQIDVAERGFSFMRDGPLDMRMSGAGVSAADICNKAGEAELARIIAVYGEERRARAIARAIVAARNEAPLRDTARLAAIVERVLPSGKARIHPARRVFQALRIFVNDELGELARALEASEALLAPEGRLAIVTFHSLEDRMVKRFLARRTGRQGRGSRHRPDTPAPPPSFTELGRACTPAADELAGNPRARSARLRTGARTHAAPHSDKQHEFRPSGLPALEACA